MVWFVLTGTSEKETFLFFINLVTDNMLESKLNIRRLITLIALILVIFISIIGDLFISTVYRFVFGIIEDD